MCFYFRLSLIELPAGILQGMFFDASRPRYMNYGGMGFIIGHEITHGFDDEGRQFDLNGNLVDWWNNGTEAHFLERAKCIIDQYSNYTEEKTKLKVIHPIMIKTNKHKSISVLIFGGADQWH